MTLILPWPVALIYEKAGEYDQAKAIYSQMLKNNPSDRTAANNLAYRMIENPTQDSDLDQAIDLARKSLIYNPGNPEIIDTLGWAYYKKGDYDQAVPLLKISHKAYSEHPIINYHLGMALYRTDRLEGARARLVGALSGQDDFPGRDEAARLVKKIPAPPKKQAVAHNPIDFNQISTKDLKSFGLGSLFEEMDAEKVSSMNSFPGSEAFKLDEPSEQGLK